MQSGFQEFEKVLVIESSTRLGQIALAQAGKVLELTILPESRRHARDLAYVTKEMLHRLGWKAQDLTSVVVSLGPGSFTGLRIGLTSAKIFAFARSLPLFGVPTFAAIAAQTSIPLEKVAILSDALQGKAFVQTFAKQQDDWVEEGPLTVQVWQRWIEQLDPKYGLSGPALESYRSKIVGNWQSTPDADQIARPQTLLDLAIRRASQYRCDPIALEPIYLRGSSAEEKLLK